MKQLSGHDPFSTVMVIFALYIEFGTECDDLQCRWGVPYLNAFPSYYSELE